MIKNKLNKNIKQQKKLFFSKPAYGNTLQKKIKHKPN